MAKRVGNIYLPNCNYTCLYNAYRKAAKGKRYRGDVLQFTDNLEGNLLALLDDLKNHTYTVGAYRGFYVYEPKKRLIMALPFRDRVAQWWVYSLLYPIFDKTFIGNLTSQLLANVYLNELDQFCKKVLGTKFYIRYMDDVIILSQSKEELHEIKERISKFLDEELQLALNKKTCIRPVSMGIQFVGLHIWSTHRTVRKSTSLRIKRRLKAAAKQYVAGNLTYERYNSTLQSYMGMMKHNDCYRFKMQLLEDVETIINESGVAA